MHGGGASETRLLVQSGKTRIKVETSPSGRGTVRPPEMRSVTTAVEDEFGFAEILTVAFEDLYGGKLSRRSTAGIHATCSTSSCSTRMRG